MGSPNRTAISFGRAELISGDYYDGATYWAMNTNNQKIDTVEVLETNIFMTIKNREVVSCTGSWYLNIYIPRKFNFDQENAKSSLKNKTVWHSDISGQSHSMKITDQALVTSKINGLKIYPIKSDDKIQLFVTWKIYVPMSTTFYTLM